MLLLYIFCSLMKSIYYTSKKASLLQEVYYMDFFNDIVTKVASMVWGPITIVLLLGTGVYLSFGTRFVQFKKMKEAFLSLFSKENEGEGDITPFQALMTSLAATIGIGNIVGVASAIALGASMEYF